MLCRGLPALCTPWPLHTHCCHPSRAKHDEVLRWWGLVLSYRFWASCEVAWQLPFPGAIFELGLSAKCAVFKEMAERFRSGPVAGNEETSYRLFKLCQRAGTEERKSPAWLVIPRIDSAPGLTRTKISPWYDDWEGWETGLREGWVFPGTGLLSTGERMPWVPWGGRALGCHGWALRAEQRNCSQR